jgi:hypothetical protein
MPASLSFVRPGDALPDGAFWDEERLGDLSGGQAADYSQGERDPGGAGQRWVAAGEDEP